MTTTYASDLADACTQRHRAAPSTAPRPYTAPQFRGPVPPPPVAVEDGSATSQLFLKILLKLKKSLAAGQRASASGLRMENISMIKIYTHGACKGGRGIGGWAAVLVHPMRRKALAGSAPHTTNNRMEITAALEGLRAIDRPSEVHVYSRLKYLPNGMESWMNTWKQRGFKTKDGAPVKNEELWRALDEQSSRHNVKWHWVGRHSSPPEINLADQLANEAVEDRLHAPYSDRNLAGESSPAPIRTEMRPVPLPDGSSQDVEIKIYEAAWAEGANRQVHGRISNKLRY